MNMKRPAIIEYYPEDELLSGYYKRGETAIGIARGDYETYRVYKTITPSSVERLNRLLDARKHPWRFTDMPMLGKKVRIARWEHTTSLAFKIPIINYGKKVGRLNIKRGSDFKIIFSFNSATGKHSLVIDRIFKRKNTYSSLTQSSANRLNRIIAPGGIVSYEVKNQLALKSDGVENTRYKIATTIGLRNYKTIPFKIEAFSK